MIPTYADPPETRRRLRLALLLSAVLSMAAVATGASAQSDPAAPELIQAVKNDKLGELNLPAFWNVEATEDGLRAVESNNGRPAAIEVGTIDVPEAVPAAAIARAMVAELTESGRSATVKREARLEAGDGVEEYYLELDTQEDSGAPSRYAVVVLSGKRRAIVAVLASPPERFDAFAPQSLLTAILASVRAP